MSKLLEQVLIESKNCSWTKAADTKWYIAKPVPFYGIPTKWQCIKDGFRVMRGKSFAVHYKEDEIVESSEF
jgi:hypothetical protein